MSEKFEFASPAWVDAARECIVELSRGQDLSAVSVSFCEEFTDPPAHLCPTGGSIGAISCSGSLEGGAIATSARQGRDEYSDDCPRRAVHRHALKNGH